MKPTILTIRAIGTEFANRIYGIVAGITACILVISLGVAIWLTTLSDWWWLLVIALTIVASVAIGVLVIVKLVIRSVTPTQNTRQRVLAKAFVDKLQRLSDTVQTPKHILLFQVVRDIAAPRDNGFIAKLSSETTSLRHDFIALSQTFK